MGARLVAQMLRLAMFLAVVLNRETVDREVMRRVKRCALDTAHGRSMKITEYLHPRRKGAHLKALSAKLCESEYNTRKLLIFMRRIGALEYVLPTKVAGVSGHPVWRMTSEFRTIYEGVMGVGIEETNGEAAQASQAY
jgi:hypothetical protein